MYSYSVIYISNLDKFNVGCKNKNLIQVFLKIKDVATFEISYTLYFNIFINMEQ